MTIREFLVEKSNAKRTNYRLVEEGICTKDELEKIREMWASGNTEMHCLANTLIDEWMREERRRWVEEYYSMHNYEEIMVLNMKLDYSDFKEKFGEWAEAFKPFIESQEMFDIYQRLKSDSVKGVTPDSESVLRAFSTTSPDNIKVVWYLMDPYPGRYRDGTKQATGIAMDCSNSPNRKLQPSLIKFYEGMEDDLSMKVNRDPSLLYLHDQGVMMLNTDLTCKVGATGSHKGLWESFQKYFLQEVMKDKKIIYVLSGKSSLDLEEYILPGNHIIKTEHPCYASRNNRGWCHNSVFSEINRILMEKGQNIFWNKDTLLWDYVGYPTPSLEKYPRAE